MICNFFFFFLFKVANNRWWLMYKFFFFSRWLCSSTMDSVELFTMEFVNSQITIEFQLEKMWKRRRIIRKELKLWVFTIGLSQQHMPQRPNLCCFNQFGFFPFYLQPCSFHLKKKKSIFLIFESLGLLPLPSFKSFFFHSCSGCPIID